MLREIKKKKNVEEKRKKKDAESLLYSKFPDNQATSILNELEKRNQEAMNAVQM